VSLAGTDRRGRSSQPSLTQDANLDVDDRITIVLDPFFDHRNGVFFEVNPAGARSDGQVSNNSESLNRDWDGIWNSAARITDDGWIAEIEIPFKTLRFKPGQSVWGFNVERQIKMAAGDRSVGRATTEHLDRESAGGGPARRRDKNLSLALYILGTDNETTEHRDAAGGFVLDYPNDRWDVALSWKQIGNASRNGTI
jgi:hypothetical protein